MARLSKSLMPKAKGKISKSAGLAKFKWDEAKHKRDQQTGQFINRPGSEAFKAETYGPGKTKGIKDDDIIKLHVTENPKKAGTGAATDFAMYKNGMTVGEFKTAIATGGAGKAKAPEHLAYDLKKGFITVHDPVQLAQRPGAGLGKPPMPAVTQLAKPADALPGAEAPKPQVPGQPAPAPAPAPAAPAPKNFLTSPTGQQFGSSAEPSLLKKSDYLITSKIKGIKENDIITMQVPHNPKKPGTKANADFAQYKDGMTVGQFHAAVGGKAKGQEHIMYDIKKGFITVHHPADLAAMKAGTLTPGTLAAHMQSNDQKLGVITKNPFQPGQNHDDFEATAKQMGLTTAKMQTGLGEPAAASATTKKGLADLDDNDIVVSPFGTEYKAGDLKKGDMASVNAFDEKIATGAWTVKAKPTGPAPDTPAKSAIKFKDDDVVETWLGNKYTVADYKIKEGIDDADADQILNEQIDDDLLQFVPKAAPPAKVAQPAPKPAPEPAPIAGQKPVSKFKNDDIVTIDSTGEKSTVAEWKKNYWGGSDNADAALDKYVTSGAIKIAPATPAPAPKPAPAPAPKPAEPAPAPAPKPAEPAPAPAPAPKPPEPAPAPAAPQNPTVAKLADDDILTTSLGNKYTVTEWKKMWSGAGHGDPDTALEGFLSSGAITSKPGKVPPGPSAVAMKKTPGGLADDAVIKTGPGTYADQYNVAEYKAMLKKQLHNPTDKDIDDFIDTAVAGGALHIVKMGSSTAPQMVTNVPKVITKLADIPEADYAKWDVTVTKPSNPYKDGTNEYKKFYNIEKTTGGSKTKTIEKYFQSTTLTKDQQKAALQQMVDDGHVKFVSPEQKAAVEAQKAKFAQTQAAEAQTKAAAEQAAKASKYKVHYEQLVKPAPWKDNTTRWGKAAGITDLKASNKSIIMEETRKAVNLPFNGVSTQAVQYYTASGYGEMNRTLRKQGFDALGPISKKHVMTLDSIMNKTKEDAIMWRGISSTGDLNNIPPPLEFPDMGYASMSHNPNVSLNTFAGRSTITGNKVLFRVRVPAGTKAAFISRRSTVSSAMADEAEVIAARGTRFKYISTTENMEVGG